MNSKYLACTGIIRARETKLIDYSKFIRLLEAADVKGVLKELGDTEYAEGLGDVREAGDFEELLIRQDQLLYKLFCDLTKDPELTDLFFLGNDFHNLKIAFKEKMSEAPSEENAGKVYMNPAKYFPENIFKAVQEENYRLLASPLKEAAIELGSRLEPSSGYQLVDVILDGKYFSYALEVVKKHGGEFLKKVFDIQVDLLNIRTFIRLKEMGVEKHVLNERLIEGGSMEKGFYMKLFEGSLEDFVSAMKFKDYFTTVKSGIEQWQKERDLSMLEKLFDDHITGFVKKAKHITFGMEPLIGYFFARKIEALNIRNILVGKLNGLPDKEIRRRLRETYI